MEQLGGRGWRDLVHLDAHRVHERRGTTHLTELRNSTLNHRTVAEPVPDTTTFMLTRPVLIGLVTGTLDLVAALSDGRVTVAGDSMRLAQLVLPSTPPSPS